MSAGQACTISGTTSGEREGQAHHLSHSTTSQGAAVSELKPATLHTLENLTFGRDLVTSSMHDSHSNMSTSSPAATTAPTHGYTLCGGGHARRTTRQTSLGRRQGRITQLPETIDDTWVQADHVGVYCEGQVGAHCGAHALHALLGRRIADSNLYLYPDLNSSMSRPGPRQLTRTDQPQFSASGWYSIEAINHWLYEHTTEDATLAPIPISPARYYVHPGRNTLRGTCWLPSTVHVIYAQ